MAVPAIYFHPGYDISFLGLERLHPFDSRKYGRAFAELQRTLGADLSRYHRVVDRPASDAELALAHTPAYLATLNRSSVIASAVEIRSLAYLPASLLHWRVLTPMRLATRGTILAMQAALETGLAFNLSGGYHHAKPDGGEGFCLFSDIAIAVRQLRADGHLAGNDRIVYIDLDAHQGNGVCHQFRDDRNVYLFDIYNQDVYPCWSDLQARDRIDCDLPVTTGCTGGEYLGLLHRRLPGFLDGLSQTQPIRLAIYNAGTDVVRDDPLGQLELSPEDVKARDCYVAEQCRQRGIPLVMLPSGGYTRESYRLVAGSIEAMVRAAQAT
jgi:histone deacetylase 11